MRMHHQMIGSIFTVCTPKGTDMLHTEHWTYLHTHTNVCGNVQTTMHTKCIHETK